MPSHNISVSALEQEIIRLQSENKHYLNELEENKKTILSLQQKIKVYFNHSDLSYLILDKDQNIVDVNDAFCMLFGYGKEEIISLPFSQIFTTPQLYHTWWKNYLNFNAFESVSNLEYRLQKKNKYIFWAELFGNKFEDNNEAFSIWSIRDISLRVRSRNTIRNLNITLQKQFKELEEILNIIPVPIFIKDKNFKYSWCNDTFCTFFEIEKEMILGKSVHDIFDSKLAYLYQQKDDEMVVIEHQIYNITIQIPPSSKEVSLEIHKKRIEKEGAFEGFVGVLIDVTEKEKQEQHLKQRIGEELERNLMIQKAHQEELIRNAKFTSIGQMAAGITHEINTPLTYIKGNIEMLLEDIALLAHSEIKEGMLRDGIVIKEGLDRIENIIQTMREASQKSTEEYEVVNLYTTLISALILSHNRSKQVVKIILGETSFDMSISKDILSYPCKLQKQRIEQVWIIILNNALDELIKIEDFDERSLRIEIGSMDEQAFVRFCDNAGGIDQDILPRIFEPFESTKVSVGSMGIGLNIAQQIVLQNGGQIQAYNHDKGAVFEVSFPLLENVNNEL